MNITSVLVSVPSFGDSFFITLCPLNVHSVHTLVSVPSFGDSFFMLMAFATVWASPVFPSPHSGILFL